MIVGLLVGSNRHRLIKTRKVSAKHQCISNHESHENIQVLAIVNLRNNRVVRSGTGRIGQETYDFECQLSPVPAASTRSCTFAAQPAGWPYCGRIAESRFA